MENDTYAPPEPIMYNYKGNFLTVDDFDGVDLDKPYDTIYICAYNVNTEGKAPFLRYLLTDHMLLDVEHVAVNSRVEANIAFLYARLHVVLGRKLILTRMLSNE